MGNLYQLGEHMLSRLLELCFAPTTAPLCQGEFDFSLLNCVNKHHSSDCFQVTPEKSRMSFAQSKVKRLSAFNTARSCSSIVDMVHPSCVLETPPSRTKELEVVTASSHCPEPPFHQPLLSRVSILPPTVVLPH
jgi:hypothetical protein